MLWSLWCYYSNIKTKAPMILVRLLCWQRWITTPFDLVLCPTDALWACWASCSYYIFITFTFFARGVIIVLSTLITDLKKLYYWNLNERCHEILICFLNRESFFFLQLTARQGVSKVCSECILKSPSLIDSALEAFISLNNRTNKVFSSYFSL